MAVYKTDTFQTTTKPTATAKTIVQRICALCSDIQIKEVDTDTTDKYSVWLSVLGYDGVLIKLYNTSNSSKYFNIYLYYENEAGTIVVDGKNYSPVSSSIQSSMLTTTGTLTFEITCVHEPGIYVGLRFGYSSYCFSICGFKSKDMCSGEERTSVGCDSSAESQKKAYCATYSAINNVCYGVSITEMLTSTVDNGYTRMHPVCVSGTGFLGHLMIPDLVYVGHSSGELLTMNGYSQFSVAGVNFASLEASGGRAIRLD